DVKKLAFTVAVELSYLSQIEQTAVSSAMDKYQIKPSLSQAVQLKNMKQSDELTVEAIDEILSKAKKPPKSEPKGTIMFLKYFPPEYSLKQMEVVIIELLTDWNAKGVAQ
ncbi:MAG: chromosome partitioning protein ParB, partial [Firmicutes bacterium]|nr:chromosome partitioning protein ParB [Bacillota bacterium]